jgi:hypothetical protein
MLPEAALNFAPRIIEPDRLLQAAPGFVRMDAHNSLPVKPPGLLQNLEMINSSQPKRSVFTLPANVKHSVWHAHRFQQPHYLMRVARASCFPIFCEIKRCRVHVLYWLKKLRRLNHASHNRRNPAAAPSGQLSLAFHTGQMPLPVTGAQGGHQVQAGSAPTALAEVEGHGVIFQCVLPLNCRRDS